jgi:hypothetical protein
LLADVDIEVVRSAWIVAPRAAFEVTNTFWPALTITDTGNEMNAFVAVIGEVIPDE